MADQVDWGDGEYERTARSLAPAADVVLDAVALAPGERLLDVACGTGNAALAAARRGARVVGVDASAGLLEVAGRRAAELGVALELAHGDALELPVADAGFDVTVSLFGVIFAPDPHRAAGELLRATRPGGRLALTSWVPTGAISAVGRLLWAALPAPPAGDRPRWGDPDWARAVLGAQGARCLEVGEEGLAFTAPSPAAWFAEQTEHHPVWRWARRRLSDERFAALSHESVELLEAANELPGAFRTTSRYLVVTARR